MGTSSSSQSGVLTDACEWTTPAAQYRVTLQYGVLLEGQSFLVDRQRTSRNRNDDGKLKNDDGLMRAKKRKTLEGWGWLLFPKLDEVLDLLT